MVTDNKDVEEVFLDKRSYSWRQPGSIVVDMSTISPLKTKEIAAKLKEKGSGCLTHLSVAVT